MNQIDRSLEDLFSLLHRFMVKQAKKCQELGISLNVFLDSCAVATLSQHGKKSQELSLVREPRDVPGGLLLATAAHWHATGPLSSGGYKQGGFSPC